jgi:hypothetical protein
VPLKRLGRQISRKHRSSIPADEQNRRVTCQEEGHGTVSSAYRIFLRGNYFSPRSHQTNAFWLLREEAFPLSTDGGDGCNDGIALTRFPTRRKDFTSVQLFCGLALDAASFAAFVATSLVTIQKITKKSFDVVVGILGDGCSCVRQRQVKKRAS